MDDEEDIRDPLRTFLEARGYYVLVAESGHSGLKLAEHFPGSIDLLIKDIRMPHMDGIEFANFPNIYCSYGPGPFAERSSG